MKVKGVLPKKSQAVQLQEEVLAIRSQLEKQHPAPEVEDDLPEEKPKTATKPRAKAALAPETVKRTRRRTRPPQAVTRLTVDLPADLYDEISQEAQDRYMTLKGYLVSVLRTRKA